MLVLEIELLAGRYHATPWGRAANEGQPEWPPAPWRLGRALASAWWRLDPTERPAEATVDALLARLASPPRFLVPRATLAHTRHYMPTGALKDGMNQTTLVLDAFARVAPGRLAVIWDGIELGDDERGALDRLCDVIGYIGRAESPCVVRRVAAASLEVDGRFAVGLYDTDGATEPVGLLCLTEAPRLAALSESTAERRKRRITAPADGRTLTYGLPPGATDPPRVRQEPTRHAATTALRFILDGPALPPVTESLRLADRYRAAVLKRADGLGDDEIAALRGRNPATGEIVTGHGHAHYLPTDEDGDGRIDHLTVWCPAGLGRAEVAALAVPVLRSWAFDHPISFGLVETLSDSAVSTAALFAEATRWRSHTPFVSVRHAKQRAGTLVDRPETQVVLELRRRGLPEPLRVEPIRPARAHWGNYRQQRDSRLREPRFPAQGFLIEFAAPVRGPISLGRNSHFGMGLFLPEGWAT